MLKKNKAQNTAEYAILIALVVGGVIAMQTYAQRALQGRMRDANVTMRDKTNVLGNTLQYEPYYSKTEATTSRTSEKENFLGGSAEQSNSIKQAGATENTTWNTTSIKTSDVDEEEGLGF